MLIASKLRDNPDRLNNFERYVKDAIPFETYKYGSIKLKNNSHNLELIKKIKNHVPGVSYKFESICGQELVLSHFKKTKDFGSNKVANELGKKLTDSAERVTILSMKQDIKTKEDTKERIFIDNPDMFETWKNTFKYTKKPVLELVDNINNYYILHDGTSKNKLFNIVNKITKKHNIKKDLWNPVDMWLIRKRTYKKILSVLKEIEDLETFNKEFYNLVQKKYILPFSLKQLSSDKVNIEECNIPPHITPKFRNIRLEVIHNYMSLDMKTIGTFVFRDEENNRIAIQTRGFNTTTNATQTEVTNDGNKKGGRIGKCPSHIISQLYKKYGNHEKIVPQTYFGSKFENVTKEKVQDWTRWYNLVSVSDKVKSNDNINNIEEYFNEWLKEKNETKIRNIKYKIQGLMMQWWFLSLSEEELSDLVNEIILGAKKVSKYGGFFYKIS